MAAGTGLLTTNNQNRVTPNAYNNGQGGFGFIGWGPSVNVNTNSIPGYTQETNENNAYYNSQQKGPYRGGMTTSFDFINNPVTGFAGLYDDDADVRGLAAAQLELQRPNEGTNSAEQQALYNMYAGRVGQKNSLAESIQGNAANERKQEDLLTGAAGQALGEGLKNTRENYNSRGLLYSGLRQGGEEKVKTGVAANLESGISGARRDAANSLSAAKNAYAAVDLANAQESLNLAHQAFDTASANNIARMQAMQQFSGGLGSIAGYAIGSMSSGSNSSSGTPSGLVSSQDMYNAYSNPYSTQGGS